jgi:hypothetical protein
MKGRGKTWPFLFFGVELLGAFRRLLVCDSLPRLKALFFSCETARLKPCPDTKPRPTCEAKTPSFLRLVRGAEAPLYRVCCRETCLVVAREERSRGGNGWWGGVLRQARGRTLKALSMSAVRKKTAARAFGASPSLTVRLLAAPEGALSACENGTAEAVLGVELAGVVVLYDFAAFHYELYLLESRDVG